MSSDTSLRSVCGIWACREVEENICSLREEHLTPKDALMVCAPILQFWHPVHTSREVKMKIISEVWLSSMNGEEDPRPQVLPGVRVPSQVGRWRWCTLLIGVARGFARVIALLSFVLVSWREVLCLCAFVTQYFA